MTPRDFPSRWHTLSPMDHGSPCFLRILETSRLGATLSLLWIMEALSSLKILLPMQPLGRMPRWHTLSPMNHRKSCLLWKLEALCLRMKHGVRLSPWDMLPPRTIYVFGTKFRSKNRLTMSCQLCFITRKSHSLTVTMTKSDLWLHVCTKPLKNKNPICVCDYVQVLEPPYSKFCGYTRPPGICLDLNFELYCP